MSRPGFTRGRLDKTADLLTAIYIAVDDLRTASGNDERLVAYTRCLEALDPFRILIQEYAKRQKPKSTAAPARTRKTAG